MYTQSETRLKSMEIDEGIRIQKRDAATAKEKFTAISTKLGSYPSQFKEYTDTIDSFEVDGTDEPGAVIRKDGQVQEFLALKSKVDEVIIFLDTIIEF